MGWSLCEDPCVLKKRRRRWNPKQPKSQDKAKHRVKYKSPPKASGILLSVHCDDSDWTKKAKETSQAHRRAGYSFDWRSECLFGKERSALTQSCLGQFPFDDEKPCRSRTLLLAAPPTISRQLMILKAHLRTAFSGTPSLKTIVEAMPSVVASANPNSKESPEAECAAGRKSPVSNGEGSVTHL